MVFNTIIYDYHQSDLIENKNGFNLKNVKSFNQGKEIIYKVILFF